MASDCQSVIGTDFAQCLVMSKQSQNQAKKRRDRVKSKQQRLLKIKAKHAQDPKQDLLQADEVSIGELKAIIERTATGPLDEQDRELLLSVSETLCYVTDQLDKKSISIARLRKL